MSLRGRHARHRRHDGRLRKSPTEVVRMYHKVVPPVRGRVNEWVERLRLFL